MCLFFHCYGMCFTFNETNFTRNFFIDYTTYVFDDKYLKLT